MVTNIRHQIPNNAEEKEFNKLISITQLNSTNRNLEVQ